MRRSGPVLAAVVLFLTACGVPGEDPPSESNVPADAEYVEDTADQYPPEDYDRWAMEDYVESYCDDYRDPENPDEDTTEVFDRCVADMEPEYDEPVQEFDPGDYYEPDEPFGYP